MSGFYKSYIEGTPEALRSLRDDINVALKNGDQRVPIYSKEKMFYKVKIVYVYRFYNSIINQQHCNYLVLT